MFYLPTTYCVQCHAGKIKHSYPFLCSNVKNTIERRKNTGRGTLNQKSICQNQAYAKVNSSAVLPEWMEDKVTSMAVAIPSLCFGYKPENRVLGKLH